MTSTPYISQVCLPTCSGVKDIPPHPYNNGVHGLIAYCTLLSLSLSAQATTHIKLNIKAEQPTSDKRTGIAIFDYSSDTAVWWSASHAKVTNQ